MPNCGCTIDYDLATKPDQGTIIYCAMHQAAPKLLKAITRLTEAIIPFTLSPVDTPGVTESRNAYLEAIVAMTEAQDA